MIIICGNSDRTSSIFFMAIVINVNFVINEVLYWWYLMFGTGFVMFSGTLDEVL